MPSSAVICATKFVILQQSLGLTSVYVTHDQEEALAVSDKIIVMNSGRIAQEGTPTDLYERPNDAFVADFIGGANLIPCELTNFEGGNARVRLGSLDLSLARAGKVGVGPALVVVRPNSVDLATAPEGGRSFPVTVRKAVYLGDHWEYTLDSAVGELFVVQPIEQRYAEGSTVHVALWPERLTLVAGS